MFKDYKFVVEILDAGEEGMIEIELNPVQLLYNLLEGTPAGEETTIMARALVSFIEEIDNKFKIIEVYESN